MTTAYPAPRIDYSVYRIAYVNLFEKQVLYISIKHRIRGLQTAME